MAIWDPNKIWTLTEYIPFPQSYPLVEHNAVHHEAWVLGIELDPSEGQEGLRERVEAVKAGDARAYSVASWVPVRAQKEQQREAAQKLAIVNGTSVDDAWAAIQQASRECDAEIRRRQPLGVALNDAPKGGLVEVAVFTGSMLEGAPIPSTAASADAIRAENRHVGEGIAKSPPPWAYPLAWRLAVMAVVEAHNNKPRPSPFAWFDEMTAAAREYHIARREGLLPGPAAEKALRAADIGDLMVDRICAAYERGRPGPGGVR